MNRIFNEIASKYNVTPDEVERDIAQALLCARKNTSNHARAFWGRIDESAGVEEIICRLSEGVRIVV